MVVSSAVTAALVGGALAGGSQIAGSAMAARSANKAADTQARAAQDALAWEKQQHAAEQQRLSPYRQMGHGAMHQLSSMLGVPGPQFEQPQPFTAGKTLAAMRGG